MTENHADETPVQRLDVAIELEKREALEYFRTDLADLRLRAAIERRAGPARRHWPIPAAASALVALGFLLIAVIPTGEARLNPSRSVLDADAVENGLLAFQQQPHAAAESPCLVPACRTESDRIWLIEAAIYHSKRIQIRGEQLENTIERALSRSRTAVTGS